MQQLPSILGVIKRGGGGGGGTAIYGLYKYVPLWRGMVFKQFLWDRVYKSESLGLEEGIIFHLNWSIG